MSLGVYGAQMSEKQVSLEHLATWCEKVGNIPVEKHVVKRKFGLSYVPPRVSLQPMHIT